MASLVSWLAYSGARKVDGTPVATGYAYFYQPDTTATQVSVYSDEDGLIAVSQPVRLDASGRAVVYTRVAARVVVQDSAGASVQLQDRGNTVTAAQVEIENPVATGTDLTTGSQVQSGRTDLDTFLSNLYESLGTTDGSVLVGGTARKIKDAFSATTAIFYNVQDSVYGARGNDSTEDSGAIQAAITAAEAAGGGIVIVPPGTYKVSTTIAVTGNKVQILGLGTPGSVIFKSYTASTAVFTITGTNFYIANVAFTMGAASAYLVSLGSGATSARFYACAFTLPSASGKGIVTTAASARAIFSACSFTQSIATGSMFEVAASSVVQVLGGNVLIPTATSAALVTGAALGMITFLGTEVSHTAATGTTSLVANTGTLQGSFQGCYFPPTGGGVLKLSAGGSAWVVEGGSILATNVIAGTVAMSGWRDARWIRTSSSATSYIPDPSVARVHEVISSGASFAWTNPSTAPAAISWSNTGGVEATTYEIVLRYTNTSGGAITPTFGTGYKIGTAPSVGNGQAAAWVFNYDSTLSKWVQVGNNPIAYTT